jgi:post-segregation antitoxin (ccd killing protein)
MVRITPEWEGYRMAAARKLNISIPDDLAKRLEPYRDRINLSRVATEAITRAVAEEESHDRGNQLAMLLLRNYPGTLALIRHWQVAPADSEERDILAEKWNELTDTAGIENEADREATLTALLVIANAQYGDVGKTD